MNEPDLSAVLSKLDPGMRLVVPMAWLRATLARHKDILRRVEELARIYGCTLGRPNSDELEFIRKVDEGMLTLA